MLADYADTFFFTAVEARYERNPGISGRMHGLKNDPTPARNETARLKIVSELMPPPSEDVKLSARRASVKNWRFATRERVPVNTKTPNAIRITPKKY